MWLFTKKELKLYIIKWKYLKYTTFNPGADIVRAKNLADAWKKVCHIHRNDCIGIIGWEEIK